MSTSEAPDVVVPGSARSLRGTAAAATVLAAALLVGIGLGPAAATSAAAPAGTVTTAPAAVDPDVAQRLVGVAQDLAEAVTHGEITAQQAECFLRQLHRRLVR